MRIGFLVNRNIFYKYFAAIIDQALKRGHTVFCFHDYTQPQKGNKAYQFPSLASMPRFRYGLAQGFVFKSEPELVALALQQKINLMVSLHFIPSYQNLRDALRQKGIAWVALQNGLDSVGQADLFNQPDRYIFYTKNWLNFSFKCQKQQGKAFDQKAIQNKAAFCGFSELDQKDLLDSYALKKKWGIPEDKKVVLFLPFPFGATDDRFWSRFVYGSGNFLMRALLVLFSFNKHIIRQALRGENDKVLCLALKNFCQRNNCFLLVKSRKKDIVKPYLAKIAHKVLYDDNFYPATILQCLAVADLCFNFLSTAVLEAVALGVPNVAIMPSTRFYANIQNPVWKILLKTQRDIFDFPGASYMLTLPEAFKALKEKNLVAFPLQPEQQARYTAKYVGKPNASAKIVSELEKTAQIKYNHLIT